MAETADLSSRLVTQRSYILSETRKSFIGCPVREKEMNPSIAFIGVPPRMQDPLWHPHRDATLPHSQPLVYSVTKINMGVLSGARLPPPSPLLQLRATFYSYAKIENAQLVGESPAWVPQKTLIWGCKEGGGSYTDQ